jgi:hypothetical protein
MTRHGLFHPQALGAAPPATDPRGPVVTVAADRTTTSNVRGRQYRAAAQRSLQSASILTRPSGSRAIADIGRTSKSP